MSEFMEWSLRWWLSDRLAFSQRVDFSCCITIQPWIFRQCERLLWIQDGHGLALLSGVVTAGIPPPARLPVEWQIQKIRESLVLDSHRPLLADGSVWNITWGMQVFPALTAGGQGGGVGWCVRRPSWTVLKRLAVTDGPKGCLPLPSRINTFFFFRI